MFTWSLGPQAYVKQGPETSTTEAFRILEGPSSQYLGLLVPKTIPSIQWYLGQETSDIGYLDPLGMPWYSKCPICSAAGC